MLITRIWMGLVLILVGLVVLVYDLPPHYPGFYLVVVVAGFVCCREMLFLVKQDHLISSVLCYTGLMAVLSANWIGRLDLWPVEYRRPWLWIIGILVCYFLALYLAEMAIFRRPSGAMIRMALSFWIVGYLGLLSSFLIQLRWYGSEMEASTTALAMAIFVPKSCDMGAYFTGRWLGRTKVAPQLSPKKTWEGAIGGLTVATALTVAIDQMGPVALLNQNWLAELGFGISVGGAGIAGDLGESLIKREYQQKDASQTVPGFGGVLDVIDALLFAGPVAYLWFVFLRPIF